MALTYNRVPMAVIPALFLMTCIRILRGENRQGAWNEKLLLIPAAALSFTALTNDLHFWVYRPDVPVSEFIVSTGTYTTGVAFYLLYTWMIGAVACGIVLVFRATGRRSAASSMPTTS